MQDKKSPRSLFESSIYGLANVSAVAVTFLSVPLVYDYTINWISSFAATHYGDTAAGFASFGWFITCALFIFFLTRASLSTGLMIGGLALATRFL